MGMRVSEEALLVVQKMRLRAAVGAVSTLRLFGDNVPYKRIADEISGVHGVITHGLILDSVRTAVIADGPEAKIIEKVGSFAHAGAFEAANDTDMKRRSLDC